MPGPRPTALAPRHQFRAESSCRCRIPDKAGGAWWIEPQLIPALRALVGTGRDVAAAGTGSAIETPSRSERGPARLTRRVARPESMEPMAPYSLLRSFEPLPVVVTTKPLLRPLSSGSRESMVPDGWSADSPQATNTGQPGSTVSSQVKAKVNGSGLVSRLPRQKYKFRPSLGGDGSR